jgi:hypothetical protein
MRVLVDSAVPARRAARMAADPASVPTPSGLAQEEVRSGSPLSDHEALTRIAVQFDPVALQRTLDEAFSLASVERVLDDWLMPSLAVLGAGWEAGNADVAAEALRAAGVPVVYVGTSCCERGARRHASSTDALRGCPARPYGPHPTRTSAGDADPVQVKARTTRSRCRSRVLGSAPEQLDHLDVGDLREPLVELADGLERHGGVEADDLVGVLADKVQGVPG